MFYLAICIAVAAFGIASAFGPIETIVYDGVDACSAYLTKGTKEDTLSRIQIVSLGSSASAQGCIEIASSWRDARQPARRCLSVCWFNSPNNETLKGRCFCLADPLWMPLRKTDEQIDSARLIWPCRDDGNCSFNGRCNVRTGRCQCSRAWKGPSCSELDLLPVDRKRLGFRAVDSDGRNVSSWGAPIVWDETSAKWHGWVSEIQNSCGINAWMTNSLIVHIEGESPYGPFERREILYPAFAHEPSVVRGPRGEWVMMFSSYRYNATGLAAVACRNCTDGTTPEISLSCPFQRGKPKELSHVFRQMISISPSPDGPWSLPVEIPQLSRAWDWNTALTINNDGSAVALIRAGFTWHSYNYSDPNAWKPVGSNKHGSGSQGPSWAGVSVEDPYIWQANGVYHALAHAFSPFYGVHAFVPIPPPGFNWSLPLDWIVTGVAYDNNVHFTDGRTHSFSRRERPHLVWAPGVREGGIALALTNGVQYAGNPNAPYTDGVFTLSQPLNTNPIDSEPML